MATTTIEQMKFSADTSAGWLRTLSGHEKEALLLGLLKELMREYGEGAPIAIESNGASYGYYVPQSASRELRVARMPTVTVDAETLEKIRDRSASSDFVDEAGFDAAFRKELGLTDAAK